MRHARIWLGVTLLVSCAACGRGYEANAYLPSTAFVEQLKVKADLLSKSELARFNALELVSKGELRYEEANNPLKPSGAIYFKEYRDYTRCRVQDVHRSDSYVYPIVIKLAFDYRLMATPARHTDFPDSARTAQADTEYKPVREEILTVDYRCNASAELVDPLPGLMPRDSLSNPLWNTMAFQGMDLGSPSSAFPVSPVQTPPSLPTAPGVQQPARSQFMPPDH